MNCDSSKSKKNFLWYLDLSSFQWHSFELIWARQQKFIANIPKLLIFGLSRRAHLYVSNILFMYMKILPEIPYSIFFHMQLVSLHLDLGFLGYDLFPKNTCFRLAVGLVKTLDSSANISENVMDEDLIFKLEIYTPILEVGF